MRLQPDMRDYTPAARRYWWLSVTIGACVIGYALWQVFRLPWSVVAIVVAGAGVAAVAGLFPVRMPGLKASLACGDIFIVLTLLVAGLPGAIVATTAEALVGTTRTTKRWTSRLITPTTNATGFLLAGSAFEAMRPALGSSMPGPLGLLIGLMSMSVIYFVFTYTAHRLLFVFKSGEPPRVGQWWLDGYLFALWLVASAAVAGLIFLAMNFGWSTLLAAMPVIAMFLATYYALAHNAEMSHRKTEFLARMSHELRTPLNAIIGGSEVLKDGVVGPLNERQDQWVRDIHESGEHLLAVINDILDISKIEAGRMELRRATVQLSDVVSGAITLVKEAAARKRIQLTFDVSPDADTIAADERKIKQVLLNLLSNAVKFTPEEGRVEVTARRNRSAVEIAVSDSGIGISAEDQKLIFDPFRQAADESARASQGTGLGLTLARDLVELHGGTLALESAPGRGSLFTVRLPDPS